MLALLDNLIWLAVFFFIAIFIFKLFLSKNRLLLRTICIFLLLHAILVAFILIEQHRFKCNLNKSIFMDDGEAYSANGWQISTALTGNIPDMETVSRMRGIHILDRAWGLERYYRNIIKERVIPPIDEYEVGAISYIYAIIYAAFGFKPVLINFMNVILHLFTAILIYKSVICIFSHRAAYLSALFFLLNPTSFYYSSTKAKESLFIFLVYLSIYLFVLTIKRRSYWYALFFLPLFYVIESLTRFQYFILIILPFAVSYLLIFFKNNKKLFCTLLLLIFFLLAIMRINLLEKINFYIKEALNYCLICQKGFYSTGGQTYQLFIMGKDNMDYSLMDWGSYFLRGWYHFLSEPILSSRISFTLLLFYPFKIIFLILCVLAIPGILTSIRYGHIGMVIFFSIIITTGTGLAMSSGNVGTMLRHRDMITPAIFVFSALYIDRFLSNFFLKDKTIDGERG